MVARNQTDPVVALDDVVKRFLVGESDVTVLKAISLRVNVGEFVAIVGPSGSGKSTLLNMITGIDRPSSGTVTVLGQQIQTMTENQLARWRGAHMGIIFQFFQLLPALTLAKNVMLPMDLAGKYRPAERRRRALELLDSVGLSDHAHKLPGMVSGGQQQRAAIARALANDPPILVADEPTGNLDSDATDRIFDLFERMVGEGKTMLMVTHEKELMQRVPRSIEIVDGQIANDANHQVAAENQRTLQAG